MRSGRVLKSMAGMSVAGMVVLLAGGCDTTKAPAAGRGDPVTRDQYPRNNPQGGLANWLYFDAPIVEREPVMRVSTPVRSTSDDYELRVQYRYIWLDADGRPQNSNPDWRYTVLPRRTQTFLDGNALDRGAKDWRLEVRPAR